MTKANAVQAWMDDALCTQVDPELFFPEDYRAARTAKKVCATCPVKDACLAYALAQTDLLGILGGTNARERNRMRDAARRAA